MAKKHHGSLVARICSGQLRLRILSSDTEKTYTLLPNTPLENYIAGELYEETLSEGLSEELYNEDELYEFLMAQELWTEKEEEQFSKLPKDIEELKVKLYKSVFRSEERKGIRKALAQLKSLYMNLYSKRHGHDHLSAEGAAHTAQMRYLLACSLHTETSVPVFGRNLCLETFRNLREDLLDEVLAARMEKLLGDDQYREIARNEPWRSLWATRSACSSFFLSPLELSDEQKWLLSWTLLYDRVMEHPECPSDEVLEDDDMLDGWLIEQRRKRGEVTNKNSLDELLTNDKVRNSDEIFIICDTIEDAKKIDAFNSPTGKMTKRQRLKYVAEHDGDINEGALPDVRQKRQMEAVRALQQMTGAK